MQKRQVFNPFLPLNEYIPDGEPHVFGDRVYIYGSHDKEGGYTFCMQDYVTYSAPVNDLSDWRYEGVIYKASQDSRYPNPQYLFAPDVVQGNDGKYYLYYCMGGDYGCKGYTGPIGVAVSDSPAGKFKFLGYVKNPDGTPMMKYVCFDPAAINDNGTIRIYYGTQYGYEEQDDFNENEKYINEEIEMFGRTKEEILSYPDSIMGPSMVVLEDDMLTVKEEAKHIIPYRVKGTSFERHPFFEGSSMRKVGDKYYFIYSSWQNHELCYATSDYPDKDFIFGGTIVSNGDIGYNGRTESEKLNMTGTTHGSIIEINNQWYVFYHRLTHKSDYSRQACAEKIYIDSDGNIAQVEVTSCGLNDEPLKAEGEYPSIIACNITNGHMPHGSNSIYTFPFPNVTNIGDERFIAEVENEMMEEMQRAIREHPIDPGKDSVYYFIQDLFHVLDENRQIASALVGPHGDIGFVHKLEQLLEEKSRESLAALVPEKSGEMKYFYSYCLNGCLGFVKTWLETGEKETPEYAAEMAYRMVVSSVTAFYDTKEGREDN